MTRKIEREDNRPDLSDHEVRLRFRQALHDAWTRPLTTREMLHGRIDVAMGFLLQVVEAWWLQRRRTKITGVPDFMCMDKKMGEVK